MNRVLKLIIFIISLISFSMICSLFVTMPSVEGSSMYPTLNSTNHNDKIIVEKLNFKKYDLNRGDVIVLKPYGNDDTLYVKRVIGLPNDVIEIRFGTLFINGVMMNEQYISEPHMCDEYIKITVPSSHVFVLGDNRDVSKDSRSIGPIPIENVKGKAVVKINMFDFSFKSLCLPAY